MTKERIRSLLAGAGAVAVGFARAAKVSDSAARTFGSWLDAGREAGMAFMHNHRDIRLDTRLLLDGAATVISMAFSYRSEPARPDCLPTISAYALLPDYHDWVRDAIRKSGVGELLGEEMRDWRICVDSAPIMERYWAVESGIAIRGDNGAAIVPGVGCEVILAEIVTTVAIEPDSPIQGDCGHCGACRRACPTGALLADRTDDCNRCLSYLTIEHRGDWTDPRHIKAMDSPAGRAMLFGCDRCVAACPHNKKHVTAISRQLTAVASLTPGDVTRMTQEQFSSAMRGSSLKRAKLAGLRRNADHVSLLNGALRLSLATASELRTSEPSNDLIASSADSSNRE